MMDLMRIPFLTIPAYLGYYPKWEPNRPADFADHIAKLKANLAEPGRREAVVRYLLEQTHGEAESRLADVSCPSLVVMGTADIDWPDPAAEAGWIVERLGSQLLLVEHAGHHPDVEQPERIADAVAAFIASIDAGTVPQETR
jgi:pimeloyl-ACP methyl ester carboxylesterase